MASMALALPGINNNQVAAITSTKGKTTGTRVTFGGVNSAANVKAQLKAANPKLKGNELTRKVNDVLTGRQALAWAEHDVLVSAMRSLGYIPNTSEVRKATGLVRYVKPAEVKEKKASVTKEQVQAMSAEERAALLELLMA